MSPSILNALVITTLVQFLNSPFFPPHIGAGENKSYPGLFFSPARVQPPYRPERKGEFRHWTITTYNDTTGKWKDTVNRETKFLIEHKLLRIPTDWRLTGWLCTQRGRGVELGATENKSR